MIDSCSDRNADPGFAATYSIPSALITSTMKSDPGRSFSNTSVAGRTSRFSAAAAVSAVLGGAAGADGAAAGVCAMAGVTSAAIAAGTAVAAAFKNPRREGAFAMG